tara:strand:- start:184 stop:384 length:201 start_codon:yes stop_codon:yes gene_type:complete
LPTQKNALSSSQANKPIYIDTWTPNIGEKYITKILPSLALRTVKAGMIKIGFIKGCQKNSIKKHPI